MVDFGGRPTIAGSFGLTILILFLYPYTDVCIKHCIQCTCTVKQISQACYSGRNRTHDPCNSRAVSYQLDYRVLNPMLWQGVPQQYKKCLGVNNINFGFYPYTDVCQHCTLSTFPESCEHIVYTRKEAVAHCRVARHHLIGGLGLNYNMHNVCYLILTDIRI